MARHRHKTSFTPHMAEGRCADQGFPVRPRLKKKKESDDEARQKMIAEYKANQNNNELISLSS
jgi:hypothetical protein